MAPQNRKNSSRKAGHLWWLKLRSARRCCTDAAARPVRRGRLHSSHAGHASLSPLRQRARLERRIWHRGRSRGLRRSREIFSLSSRSRRCGLSRHYDRFRRCRPELQPPARPQDDRRAAGGQHFQTSHFSRLQQVSRAFSGASARRTSRSAHGSHGVSLRPVAVAGVRVEAFVMSFLILKAYLKLIHFDLYLARGNFAALYEKVRNYPVGTQTAAPDAVERICSAIDMACIWYWKEALCLQRSAATACLLKKYGVPAQLVIGAQHMPFNAHASAEIGGRLVNHKPTTP